MPTSILCTSGLAGPWIGMMPGTRTPFTVPPAANSRRHCPSLLLPPAHKGMRDSGGFNLSPLHQVVAVLRRRAVPRPVLAISEQPARRLVVSIALPAEEDARGVDAAEVQAEEPRP